MILPLWIYPRIIEAPYWWLVPLSDKNRNFNRLSIYISDRWGTSSSKKNNFYKTECWYCGGLILWKQSFGEGVGHAPVELKEVAVIWAALIPFKLSGEFWLPLFLGSPLLVTTNILLLALVLCLWVLKRGALFTFEESQGFRTIWGRLLHFIKLNGNFSWVLY